MGSDFVSSDPWRDIESIPNIPHARRVVVRCKSRAQYKVGGDVVSQNPQGVNSGGQVP